MRVIRKRFKLILILTFAVTLLSGYSCLSYIAHVSYNHMKIVFSRQDISDVLKDPKVDDETKRKLSMLPKVQKFAVTKLGFKESESYLYYAKVDRPYVVYNVVACKPLELKPHTWWFPFAGSVPYKGYYDKEMAVEVMKEFKAEGYDTRVRGATAYSTLGWFDDPILSTTLRYNDSQIIDTVFHELAHATLYFPGDTRFNESFASFAAEKATIQYLTDTFGAGSKEVKKYQLGQEDRRVFIQAIKSVAVELNDLYTSELTDEKKLAGKQKIIEEFKQRGLAGDFKFKQKNAYHSYFKKKLNNTHFQSVLRYHSGYGAFSRFFQSAGEKLPPFFAAMAKLEELEPKERWAKLE